MRKLILIFTLVGASALAQVPRISASAPSVKEGQAVTVSCTAGCSGLAWKVNGVTGGSASTGTIAGNDSAATYTAPASIVAANQKLGCQVGPNDAVWNTPVTGLPIITALRGFSNLTSSFLTHYAYGQFGNTSNPIAGSLFAGYRDTPTVVHSSTAPQVHLIAAYQGNAIQSVPYPLWPDDHKENGVYSGNGGQDHHRIIVDTDNNCEPIYETYADNSVAPLSCSGHPDWTCYSYDGWALVYPDKYAWTGGTDAASNPMAPYIPTLAEFQAGVIKHALRFELPGPVIGGSSQLEYNGVWPAPYWNGQCSPGVVGISIANGGSGYSAGTTISFSGGGGDGTATGTLIITNGVITGYTIVKTGHNYTSAPTITLGNTGGGTGAQLTAQIFQPCSPFAARWKLDDAFYTAHAGASCPAGSNCWTGAGLVIATALHDYGMFLNDDTCCGEFSLDVSGDVQLDPATASSINSAVSTMNVLNFDIVDESNLADNGTTSWNPGGGTCSPYACQTSQVLPGNKAAVTPPGAIWITATNASGTSSAVALIGVAPTIGVQYNEVSILAGDYSGSKGTNGGYQFTAWVNNSPGGNAVTWSCISCANGGNITGSGVYTPPATLSTDGLQDQVRVTLNADTNVHQDVYINLLPNSGNYLPNQIRINVGRSSDYGPDQNGYYWLSNRAYDTENPHSFSDATWPRLVSPTVNGGTAESVVYQTGVWSGDDMNYHFIVPNGNYHIRMMGGISINTSNSVSFTGWNHMPMHFATTDRGVGVVKGLYYDIQENAAGGPFRTGSNADFVMGSTVTDNVLTVAAMTAIPANQWSTPPCSPSNNGCNLSDAQLQGIDIEQDSTAPYWAIGVTDAFPASNPRNSYVSNQPLVAPGKKITLYVQDWYTGMTDPIWSIMSGPGTVVAGTQMLNAGTAVPVATYTAPSSSTPAHQFVRVKAQSQSNPAVSATILIRLDGSAGAGIQIK